MRRPWRSIRNDNDGDPLDVRLSMGLRVEPLP